ncbi:helix-turn-helix domain-containing protein [Bacillus spongiae]|uniref:Helix-turn-helix domain-containing protein n=1 Tax=Bacillus spongiae TaxID=2683610 RepID=A0ABU8HEL8_9BACI
MDFSKIGEEIFMLRKSIGMSQTELSKGICTQAQISKIEKGLVYPYATTLYQIAKKLGVDLNYFFDIASSPNISYIKELESLLKQYRRKMEYKKIQDIIHDERKNPLVINNKYNFQLLLWHQGICLYHLDNQPKEAISILNQAIELTNQHLKVYSEREIEIINSKSVIYFEQHEYDLMLLEYKGIMGQLDSLHTQIDPTIKTRILYNTAKGLTRKEEYEQSIHYCMEGIEWCQETDNMYLFAELHYHIGYNYEALNDWQSAYEFMSKALFMFDIQNNHQYTPLIHRKLDDIHHLLLQ